jgi:hypothetical protein
LFGIELLDSSKTQEEENKNRNTMDADNNQPPSVDLGNGTQQYQNGTLITMEFCYIKIGMTTGMIMGTKTVILLGTVVSILHVIVMTVTIVIVDAPRVLDVNGNIWLNLILIKARMIQTAVNHS